MRYWSARRGLINGSAHKRLSKKGFLAMDLGGLAEFVWLLFFASMAVAFALNLGAAFLGARTNVVCPQRATLAGVVLGMFVTLSAGWLLLVYAEPWLWLAFGLGPAAAFGIARYCSRQRATASREPQAVSAIAILLIICLLLAMSRILRWAGT
jgi:hypothetical protein